MTTVSGNNGEVAIDSDVDCERLKAPVKIVPGSDNKSSEMDCKFCGKNLKSKRSLKNHIKVRNNTKEKITS